MTVTVRITVPTSDLLPGDETEWSNFEVDGKIFGGPEYVVGLVERYDIVGVRLSSDPEIVWMWPPMTMWTVKRPLPTTRSPIQLPTEVSRPQMDSVNWIGDAFPKNADLENDFWNGVRLKDRPWLPEGIDPDDGQKIEFKFELFKHEQIYTGIFRWHHQTSEFTADGCGIYSEDGTKLLRWPTTHPQKFKGWRALE